LRAAPAFERSRVESRAGLINRFLKKNYLPPPIVKKLSIFLNQRPGRRPSAVASLVTEEIIDVSMVFKDIDDLEAPGAAYGRAGPSSAPIASSAVSAISLRCPGLTARVPADISAGARGSADFLDWMKRLARNDSSCCRIEMACTGSRKDA
jgi:hypothetical protein